MTKELRRLSIIVLVMFLALFGSTSTIQVLQAGNLADDPNNRRTTLDAYETQRGAIIAGGSEIATSVQSTDLYVWQRQYADSPMWSHVTGFLNPSLSSATGLGVQDALRALAREMDAAKLAEAEAQPAEAWQP